MSRSRTNPGTGAYPAGPGSEPDAGTGPGTGQSPDPGSDPASDPASNPGSDLGADPGSDPGSAALPEVEYSDRGLPAWLEPVVRVAGTVEPKQLSRFLPPSDGAGRPSAVLVLFGEGADGPELLLMERASSLRSHAGQPSFPGGALDPQDGDPHGDGPLRAALREAEEETGLDPTGVQIFATLPALYIPVSGFVVTPVLGWWRRPTPVSPVDPAETARVFTVPVSELTAPENRAMAVHPSGYTGPAFCVGPALVWGFTAGVIDRLLHYAGWERPWDRDRRVTIDRKG